MRPDEGHIEEEGFVLFARLADEFRLPVDEHVRRIPIALPDARRIGGHTLAVDIDRLREPLRLVGIIELARRRGERLVEAALPRADAAREARKSTRLNSSH